MSSADEPREVVIQPRHGWSWRDVDEVWEYRDLFWVLVMRDLKVRYAQTLVGAGWALLQPVMTMAIFTVIFGRLARIPSDDLPYSLFVFAALLPWLFFANAVAHSSQSLVVSVDLVMKVYFPRIIIPLTAIGAWLLDFFVASCLLMLMIVWHGVPLGANLLMIPFLLLILVMFAAGVGVFLAALTVIYRDFRFVVPFMLQIWLFASPVIYPSSMAPEQWRWLLNLNPMTGIIEGFRSAFLGRPFDLEQLGFSIAFALAVFGVGLWHFRRVENRFADVI